MKLVAADIGGTNARFALAEIMDDGKARLGDVRGYATARHPDLASAWAAFAHDTPGPLPRAAAIAVAAPIEGEVLRFVNSPWTIRRAAVCEDLGLDRLTLLNDFEAMAFGVDALGHAATEHLAGPDAPLPAEGVTTVIGPGTGLGCAILARRDGRATVIGTDTAHCDFAPLDTVEDAILADLRRSLGRVSDERLVSGPGLRLIYSALAQIAGKAVPARSDADLWSAALGGDDPQAAAALERLCMILGAVTGDAALSHGAMGVAVVGALANRMAHHLRRPGFHARFTAKGRYQERMGRIPVRLVTHAHTGLVGAAAAYARAEMMQRS